MQNYNTACCLHRCETQSLTIRDKHRLTVSKTRVLRKILGPEGEQVREEWRKLHNDELHDL